MFLQKVTHVSNVIKTQLFGLQVNIFQTLNVFIIINYEFLKNFTIPNVYQLPFVFQVNEFLLLANNKYGYNREQAMGLLYFHHYDIEKAIIDLKKFTPLLDNWTFEDMVRFESAIDKYGKDFSLIKQVVYIILYSMIYCNI